MARRGATLRKMARELSVLCGVDVALVIAAEDAADVWESREGVLARYRALPPEARARHAHRAYLEAELGKKEAKLARVRQGGPSGLRDDAALDLLDGGVAATAGDARRLLEDIDAAIRAAEDRRAALGMPAGDGEDGGGDGEVLEGVAPLESAPGVVDGGDYYLPNHGDANGQAIWGNDDGGFRPCGAAADMQTGGYGFQFQEQCATSGGGAGMDGYYNMQMAPGMYGDSGSHVADAYPYQMLRHAQPDLAPMWSAAADEPRHGMVPLPAEYTSADTGLSYYNYMDTPAATYASLQGNQGNGGMPFATGAASGDFVYSPPALSLATGNAGGDFISAPPTAPLTNATGGAGDNKFTYATTGQHLAVSYYSGELKDAGWYDAAQWQQTAGPWPRRDGGGQQPIDEHLHYLSDLEHTQLHLRGN